MMATTHMLVGMLLGALVSLGTPVSLPLAVAAGAAGGLLPDLDMPFAHRRTFHFPVYGSIIAVGALTALAVFPSVLTAVGFIVAGGFALHPVMDAYGGGLGLRPWLGNDDRAVYDHSRGKWIRTRERGLAYDGSPKDLVIALSLVVVLALAFPFSSVFLAVLATIAVVSVLYTVLRKPIVDFGVWFLDWLPQRLARFIPFDADERADEQRK